jgi:hypothetical protein
MNKEDNFKFDFKYESYEKRYWLIRKRFMWLFWKPFEKYPYKILSDGSPNFNEVSNYVNSLNNSKK